MRWQTLLLIPPCAIVAKNNLSLDDITLIQEEAAKELESELTDEVESDLKTKIIDLFVIDFPKVLLAAARNGASEESAREVIDLVANILDDKAEELIEKYPIAEEAIRKEIDSFRESFTGRKEENVKQYK